LLLTLGVLVFAKDNYIFDYASDALINERIDKIEKEIASLNGDLAALKKDQKDQTAIAKREGDAAKIKKLEGDVARLVKENASIVATHTKIINAQTAGARTSVQIVERPSADLDDRLEKLEASLAALQKTPASGGAAANANDSVTARKVDTLADRVFALEASAKEVASRVDNGAGLPFDQYLTITKAHIEYFILGLVVFVALLFLLLLIALGRASRAESKIAQLVKLYQSSSRKSEDRK
jgi:hypothetical protein